MTDKQSTPIQAALEAAAYAECSAPGNGHVCICKHDGALSPSCRDGAAASVAAFLRALPDQYTRGGAAFWDAIPAQVETRLWLANAVERETANA